MKKGLRYLLPQSFGEKLRCHRYSTQMAVSQRSPYLDQYPLYRRLKTGPDMIPKADQL